MAEIKIKKKAPIWPWILGALVVGLIVYLLVSNDAVNDRDNIRVDATEEVPVASSFQEERNFTDIDEYNAFVADENMDVTHEYSGNALSKLIDATWDAADKLNIDVSAELSRAEDLSEEI